MSMGGGTAMNVSGVAAFKNTGAGQPVGLNVRATVASPALPVIESLAERIGDCGRDVGQLVERSAHMLHRLTGNAPILYDENGGVPAEPGSTLGQLHARIERLDREITAMRRLVDALEVL